MNIVIPMAGEGSRFKKVGFAKPKPFIDVQGVSMIERVLDNLKYPNAKYTLIVREEHAVSEAAALEALKKKYDVRFISVNKLTEGAICTILLSVRGINNQEPLLLANSDQIVEMDIADFIDDSDTRSLDGSILTFFADHPKWSYAKVDEKGLLIYLREKEVISQHATVGLYYFKEGRRFVESAVEMIAFNDRVNNEFYTAPAYNYAVKNRLKIGIFEIKESQMFGLGTPEDLSIYIDHLHKN